MHHVSLQWTDGTVIPCLLWVAIWPQTSQHIKFSIRQGSK